MNSKMANAVFTISKAKANLNKYGAPANSNEVGQSANPRKIPPNIHRASTARKGTSTIVKRGPHGDVIIITPARARGRQPRMADIVSKLKQQREPSPELPPTRCDKFRKMCHDNFKSWGKRILILAVLIAYAFLGAVIFYYIEGPEEKRIKIEETKILDQTVGNLSSSILQLITDPKVDSGIDGKLLKLLKTKFEELGIYPDMKPAWTMWGSLFYAGTIFTTIGYGNIAPVTYIGQIMTMIYALVGIPLLLACLNDFGRCLNRFLNRLWTRLTYFYWKMKKKAWCYCCKCCLKQTDSPSNGNLLSKEDAFDDFEAYEDMFKDSEEFSFPISLALLIIIGWLFACAAIFTLWEKWTYFEAFYFFFISLSTIGLGDVLPEHPARLMLCFPLVIIGLSLITLVINLIQQKLEELKEYTEDMIEDQIYDDSSTESDSDSDNEQNKSKEPKKKTSVQANRGGDIAPSLGVFQVWRDKAGHRPHRHRRGVQTDESYVRALKTELRRRFPAEPMGASIYRSLPKDFMVHSRDDVNSLMDDLAV